MKIFDGMTYNIRGFWLGVKTPKLMMLGLIRLAAVIIITIIFASLILVYHQERKAGGFYGYGTFFPGYFLFFS
jgi:CysZ protein